MVSSSPIPQPTILHRPLPLFLLLNSPILPPPAQIPARRPALHERPDGAQVALVAQEERLLAAFAPEVDGVRQRVDGLLVAADEAAAEVDALQVVLFRLQVGDLADVVTTGRGQLWVSSSELFKISL